MAASPLGSALRTFFRNSVFLVSMGLQPAFHRLQRARAQG
jgi:hypothetical protein